jgi:hypothetical protein
VLAALDNLHGGVVNAPVYRFVKMFGKQEFLNPMGRLVLDQNGAQQGLLGLGVVGGFAVIQGITLSIDLSAVYG